MIGIIIGCIYILTILIELLEGIIRKESHAVLPIISVFIIIPIWLSGLSGIETFSSSVGSYLSLQNERVALLLVQLSVSLAMLVFICGFVRSMYTITLLDNGGWWELKYFSSAFKESNKEYYIEIVLRILIGIAFLLHQSSINQLNSLSIMGGSSNILLPTSMYSIGAAFGFNSLEIASLGVNELYEVVWRNAALSGYVVFILIAVWTYLSNVVIKKYVNNLDEAERKKSLKDLKRQKRVQIIAFSCGMVTTTWIYIFSQIHSGYFSFIDSYSKHEVVAAMATAGSISSFIMLAAVFIPQVYRIIIKLSKEYWPK